MAFINQIETAVPAFGTSQSGILEFMLNNYDIPETDLGKVKALYARSGINHRNSIIPDFNPEYKEQLLFHHKNPTMDQRMEIYMEKAMPLCLDAVAKIDYVKESITHLITVSCTGMSAPGLDILLMQKLQLNNNITRTSVNFMGCYAAVHALKLADAYCAHDANAKVMIVLVETCTLHFQKEYSIENIATSMLFADGAAAIIVSNQKTDDSLRMHNFYSEVHNSSLQDMTWNLSTTGFKMTLSAYVPDIIAENIKELLARAIASANLGKGVDHWAIHPGGKKIIAEIKSALQISDEDVKDSVHILANYGNMSSVTLPFVIKEKLKSVQSDQTIFACAFGPGLTMETMMLVR